MKIKSVVILLMLSSMQNSFSQTYAQKLGKATIDYVDSIAWAKGLKESKCGKFEKNEDKFWKNPNLAVAYAVKNAEKFTTDKEREILKNRLDELVIFSTKQNLDFYNSVPTSDCEKLVKQFDDEYVKRLNVYKSLLN